MRHSYSRPRHAVAALPAALLGLVLAVATSQAAPPGGRPAAWGNDSYGQLGIGRVDNRAHPQPQPVLDLQGVGAISGGIEHSLALRRDDTVWAWGGNQWGQLGDGTTTPRAQPVQVLALHGATQVAAGGVFSLALRFDGTVRAWGSNTIGQLGKGTVCRIPPLGCGQTTPVRVYNLTDVTQVAAGGTSGWR